MNEQTNPLPKAKIGHNPCGYTALERAAYAHDFTCQEFDIPEWRLQKEDPYQLNVLGVTPKSTPETKAFIEGFMVAMAFCTGSISGGRMRELFRDVYPDIDEFKLQSWANSVMGMQSLWEKNEAPKPTGFTCACLNCECKKPVNERGTLCFTCKRGGKESG